SAERIPLSEHERVVDAKVQAAEARCYAEAQEMVAGAREEARQELVRQAEAAAQTLAESTARISQLEHSISTLEARVEAGREEVAQAEAAVQEERAKRTSTSGEAHQAAISAAKVQEKLDFAVQRTASLEKQLNEATAQLTVTTEKSQTQASDLAAATSRVASLEATLADTAARLSASEDEAHAQSQAASTSQAQLDGVSQKAQELAEQLAEAKETCSTLRTRLDESDKTCSSLAEDKARLTAELSSESASLADLTERERKARDDGAMATAQLEDARKETQALTSRCDVLTAENGHLLETLQERQDQLKSEQQTSSRLEERLERLEGEIPPLRQERDRLVESLSKANAETTVVRRELQIQTQAREEAVSGKDEETRDKANVLLENVDLRQQAKVTTLKDIVTQLDRVFKSDIRAIRADNEATKADLNKGLVDLGTKCGFAINGLHNYFKSHHTKATETEKRLRKRLEEFALRSGSEQSALQDMVTQAEERIRQTEERERERVRVAEEREAAAAAETLAVKDQLERANTALSDTLEQERRRGIRRVEAVERMVNDSQEQAVEPYKNALDDLRNTLVDLRARYRSDMDTREREIVEQVRMAVNRARDRGEQLNVDDIFRR
ncbi:hypothetical protein KIPB_003577, partial [Kipferlia bialata]